MKRKIKVFIVVEPTAGGTRKYIVDLLMRLDLSTFEATLVYSTVRSDELFTLSLPKIKKLGIKTLEIPMTREVSLKSDIVSFYKIWQAIRTGKPDIVHCHCSKAGFLGRFAAKLSLTKAKTIFTPHGLSTHVNRKYWWLEKIAAMFTDTAVAVSRSEYDDFLGQKLFKESRANLIELGVDCTVAIKPIDIRSVLGIPKEAVIAVCVGGLDLAKNPFGFLQTAKIVDSLDKNIHFIWIGDGELRSEAESFIKEHGIEKTCHLIGWHQSPQNIVADCDIFVLTSNYESFGYVICEAMLSRLPVIATDVMGPRSIVVVGETGYLIPNGNWKTFALTVLKLAHTPDLRLSLGNMGRQRVEQNFNVSNMIKKTETLYLHTVSESSSTLYKRKSAQS